MKTYIIYPGTFDPITFGHIDLIERAMSLFDNLIIAIAEGYTKKPLFSLKERISLIKEVFKHNTKIKVIGFNGLLINCAKKYQCNVVLRGLRVISDFDYEFQLAGINRALDPSIETIFMVPGEQFSCISSTLIREIAALKGDVSQFVPQLVANALKDKFL